MSPGRKAAKMRWTVIRGASLQSVPWRNGHGTTRNIVTRLARDGHMLWQVGVAELAADAPFSSFPHCDRVFTPVEGDPPVELSFEGGAFTPCPLLVPLRFAGERACRCRVTAPGRAFNAIADRRHAAASVEVLRLGAGDAVPAPEAPDVLVYCLSGAIAACGELLRPGDSLLGPGPALPGAAAEDGVAIIVGITPV